MPRRVDYPARFAFYREAAFAVVHHDGVGALSRARLATELGTSEASVRRILDPSVHLARLAADHVAELRRRDHFRWPHPAVPGRGDPVNPRDPVGPLLRLLPLDPEAIVRETVWWRLLTAVEPSAPRDPEALRDAYRVAFEPPGPLCPPVERSDEPAPRPVWTALRQHVEDREAELRVVLGAVVPGAEESVRALVEGLTWGLCLARIGPDAAVETLRQATSAQARVGTVGDPASLSS